jgi:hypothetical protein
LKARKDIPSNQKEIVIDQIVRGSNLKDFVKSTHLFGLAVKDLSAVIMDVIKLLNAQKKIYFATRYHDPYKT